MRVGLTGPIAPDRFAENTSDALDRAGHSVTRLGPAGPFQGNRIANRVKTITRQALPGVDERAQRWILRVAQGAGCEMIINVGSRLMPAMVPWLSRGGARAAFWFPDHVTNMRRQLMLLAPYDALLFNESHLVERVRANLGLPVYYLPQACNRRWHRPLVPAGSGPHLVIVSGQNPSRVRLLERLVAEGIPLKVYGGSFPRWIGDTTARSVHTDRYVVREEKARVFRSAAGVLNTMHPAEIADVNSRLFEAAGCGAAVLTEHRAAVPELFEVGDEVLMFRDFDELVDQATRLLSEDGLTARLGDAAAQRARRKHAYDLRSAEILDKVS